MEDDSGSAKKRARLGNYDLFEGKSSVVRATADNLKVRGPEYDLIPLQIVLRDYCAAQAEELPEHVRRSIMDVPISDDRVRPLWHATLVSCKWGKVEFLCPFLLLAGGLWLAEGGHAVQPALRLLQGARG